MINPKTTQRKAVGVAARRIFLRHVIGVVIAAISIVFTIGSRLAAVSAAETITLEDSKCRLVWQREASGWRLTEVVVQSASGGLAAGTPSGEYTLLFSAAPPSTEPVPVPWTGPGGSFPEPSYGHVRAKWREATTPTALNLAGQAVHFFPEQGALSDDRVAAFSQQSEMAAFRAEWRLDPRHPGDVLASLTITARQDGYFSISSPTVATVEPDDLAFAMVPGVFAGSQFESDLVLALGYGQGLPGRPVLARERSTATLTSIASHKSGATIAVIAEPGTATDPWTHDRNTRQEWRLGLSHMNRRGQLAGTLYHPVLGQVGSRLAAGDTRTFRVRFSLGATDWFGALRHAAYDVYGLREFLELKSPSRPLSDRLTSMHGYVTDDATSKWRTEQFAGLTIGAQAYLGGVVGSDRDAMKNSDYGAMWMLGRLTSDPLLVRDRLPYARAFKFVQQQAEPGFFQGAAIGQYYLSKSKRFAEEWGAYVEPVALTFYVLSDLGNILLFEPDDEECRRRLRLGADRLLSWQHADGHWEVAYDRATNEPMFTDLPDYRPTFYGLLIAYRALGDEKYLAAARRGADWLIEHAVERTRFVGVCGDVRFAPDFATAQVAQALLDLHEVTGEPRYRDAAIAATRFYVSSVYTHPRSTGASKVVAGAERADWEISQMGLGFEHGGTLGSATGAGPILLASHAGLFIRVHQLTGEPLLRDLARAATVAREAFVDPATSVASYYWSWMARGPGSFPHHAWWQIGWITDYLVSEASLRSKGQIAFPRGYFTPKVGPHAPYGFAPGHVFSEEVELAWGDPKIEKAEVDWLLATAKGRQRVYVVLLNSAAYEVDTLVTPDPTALTGGAAPRWLQAAILSADGKATELAVGNRAWQVTLPPYGIAALRLDF